MVIFVLESTKILILCSTTSYFWSIAIYLVYSSLHVPNIKLNGSSHLRGHSIPNKCKTVCWTFWKFMKLLVWNNWLLIPVWVKIMPFECLEYYNWSITFDKSNENCFSWDGDILALKSFSTVFSTQSSQFTRKRRKT